jgi:hypothetical protein
VSDAIQLAVLAGAMIVAGLMALYRRGPAIPKPEWPPSPTWSSRRDLLFALTSGLLFGMGVLFASLSVLAIVLSSVNGNG